MMQRTAKPGMFIITFFVMLGSAPVASGMESNEGLLYLEVIHDLGYFEFSMQIRSVDDPERFYKSSVMKGMHHNPIALPAGKYYFEALVGPSQAAFRRVSTPTAWFEVKAGCLNYAGYWSVLVAPTQGQVKRNETLKRGYPLEPLDRLVKRMHDTLGDLPICISRIGEPAAILEP